MKFRFGVFNIVFLLLLTIGTSYAQQYPAANQVKYPMNLYSGADTKGVLVIGSGAPSFTPKAKQSRVYVDSVAGNMYARKNGAWVLIAGKTTSFAETNLTLTGHRRHKGGGYDLWLDSIARFSVVATTNAYITSPTIGLNGTSTYITGDKFYVSIPSRTAAPTGAFLHRTAGDSLTYTEFGIKPGIPADYSMLYFDTASKQYKAIGIFTALLTGTRYANDADAGAAGIGVGWYYPLANPNDYSLPIGTVRQRQ